MRTGAILLGMLAAVAVVPRLVSIFVRRWLSDVGGYLEEQHPVDQEDVNWPVGGGGVGAHIPGGMGF